MYITITLKCIQLYMEIVNITLFFPLKAVYHSLIALTGTDGVLQDSPSRVHEGVLPCHYYRKDSKIQDEGGDA